MIRYPDIELKISQLIDRYNPDAILEILNKIDFFLKEINFDSYKDILSVTADEFDVRIRDIVPTNGVLPMTLDGTNARRVISKLMRQKYAISSQGVALMLQVNKRTIYKYLKEFKFMEENPAQYKDVLDKYQNIIDRINNTEQ